MKARKHDGEVPVEKCFFSIPRTKERYARYRNNNYNLKNDIITDFFTNIHNIIQNDIRDLEILERKFSSNLRLNYYKMGTCWT